MKTLSYISILFGIVLFLTGCVNSQLKLTKTQCEEKNKVNFLWTSGECINHEVFHGHKKNKVIVFLHNTSPTYENAMALIFNSGMNISNRTGITTYILNMPGYSGSTSNNFHKMLYSRSNYNPVNYSFTKFTANMLKHIKNKENANELYVIGHSAGATLAATISGMRPNLINHIIAYEGNYDWIYYRQSRGWSLGFPAVTGMNYVSKVENTKFLIMYGELSNKKRPDESVRYARALRSKGKEVILAKFKGLGHGINEHNIHGKQPYEVIYDYINNNIDKKNLNYGHLHSNIYNSKYLAEMLILKSL